MDEKGLIDKSIDKIFSIRGKAIYLIAIFLIGFILRLIAAVNLGVSADDMHFVTHAINFYSSGRLITYNQSSGLWFAFTSIMYKLFGLTQLSSRIAALIFGTFSILVIYLLAKEFFDDKIGLIAAFLLAIAPFHIKLTIAEQDVMAMFFVLLGMLIFVRALKANKTGMFILSGIFIGLAIYTKVYPLLFIPSLLLYAVYFKRRNQMKIFNRENIKKLFIFLFCIFIFAIPALTHNYLLYKDKGFLDLQFTRTFGLGRNISAQYYGWDHQFNAKNDWAGLIFGNSSNSGSPTPTLWQAIDYIRIGDPIIFYLGILGILILIFYKGIKFDKKYLWFLVLSIIFALPFLASIILLPKHYVFLEILLIPVAAVALDGINNKLNSVTGRNLTKIIIIIVLLVSLIFLGLSGRGTNTHFYGKSSVAQAIDFKNNIPENALIVGDSRIYRGTLHWMLQGRPYLEGIDFINLFNQQAQMEGEINGVDVYYFECVTDDCGWGNIKEQPEFNETMESLTENFKNDGKFLASFNEPVREQKFIPFIATNKIETMKVYQMNIPISQGILIEARKPRNWFLYDIGYKPKEGQFDYYEANSFYGGLDKIAHWIVTLALLIAFISPLYVAYIIIKKLNN